MPINADRWLFDTSAALAFVDEDSPFHRAVWNLGAATERGLAGHANVETYSVLTRLPLPKRLSARDAALLISTEFPSPRFLDPASAATLIDEFANAGVVGGSVYDGLVGACAREAGIPLLTCDSRAVPVYSVLGVPHTLVH